MIRVLLAGLLMVACEKGKEPPARPPPVIPEVEIKRAVDACEAYVAAVCKCAETVEAAKRPCDLAKPLTEAIDVSRRLASNPVAEKEDAMQAADNIRKTVKTCVEETARLHELGCP